MGVVIEIIKQARKSHENWLEYLTKHPELRNRKEFKYVGTLSHHKVWIEYYNVVLKKLGEINKLETKLENEQKASSTYRTALQDIAAQSIIANTVESMVYVAKAAISVGRDQRSGK